MDFFNPGTGTSLAIAVAASAYLLLQSEKFFRYVKYIFVCEVTIACVLVHNAQQLKKKLLFLNEKSISSVKNGSGRTNTLK